MTSLAVTYVAMVTAAENDDVISLKHLLQTGADVNANLDDDIGISRAVYLFIRSSQDYRGCRPTLTHNLHITSSLAVAEKPRCRLCQFWVGGGT